MRGMRALRRLYLEQMSSLMGRLSLLISAKRRCFTAVTLPNLRVTRSLLDEDSHGMSSSAYDTVFRVPSSHTHIKHPKPRVHHKVDFHIWGHLRHSQSSASQGSEEANRPTSAGHPASGSTYLSVSQTYHSECTLKTVHSLHLSTRNMRLTLNLHDLVRSP